VHPVSSGVTDRKGAPIGEDHVLRQRRITREEEERREGAWPAVEATWGALAGCAAVLGEERGGVGHDPG
jgi:hypothetical protein